jgi:hypothetical protein
MSKLRGRLTYANVMATIAVFIALGGASYAAIKLPKNSVGTKQIKKNAVKGSKVAKDSLTGADIEESTLGTVPTATRAATAARADSAGDASTLQGRGADAFIQGSGGMAAERRDLGKGDTGVTLIVIPGVAELTTGCTAAQQFELRVTNISGGTVDFSFDPVGVGGFAPQLGEMGPGADSEFTTIEDGHVTWQVATRSAPPSIATFDVTFGYGGLSDCLIYAQAAWRT